MAASAEENKLVEFCKSEGISFESSDNLIKLCKGYKIPVDVLSELNWQVAYLRVFKKNILPNSLTETQRRKRLAT
ncbi:MAG: hypothetical protein IPF65_07315 [Polaromonas sp.]|nr:hypothetical protein [Polaromonas sp.]